MRRFDADIAVLGGGPAGAVAAGLLAREGYRVVLADAGPAAGTRIESLVPVAVPLIRSLGLGQVLRAAVLGRAERTDLLWRDDAETIRHRPHAPLLVDARRLRAGLRAAAVLSGARLVRTRLRPQPSVCGGVRLGAPGRDLTVRFLIDARGRNRLCGVEESVVTPADLVALPFSAEITAGSGCRMLLEARRDGWLWAAEVPGRLSGLLAAPASAFAAQDDAGRAALLERALSESAFLRGLGARVDGAPLAASHRALQDPFAGLCHLRIGDAALARDPVASHGLAHALRSAAQAARAVPALLAGGEEAEAAGAFLRDRHAAAAAAALRATERCYARHRHLGAGTDVPATPEGSVGRNARRLRLAAALRPGAVMDGERFRWATVLPLEQGDTAGFLGPFTAAELGARLVAPGGFGDLAARLADRLSPDAAAQLLDRLLTEGVLETAD